ncbi:hypothetical protein MKW98_008790 [Papaver atlanticum]|uniref:DUF4283 domain-containing protein n=1 Tax=Papaver atlanticum TaxID=357466 RepID=A0AAD4TBD1_9MAGN|nr:hypothetical protein MKW98_008790 [Papaver atlanticum]
MVENESNMGFADFPPLIVSNGKEGHKISISSSDAGFEHLKSKIGGEKQKGNDGSVNKLEIVSHGKAVGGFDSNGVGVPSASSSREWRTLYPYAKPTQPQIPMKIFPSAELNGKRVVDYAAGDFSTGIKRCEEYGVGFCVGKRLSFPAIKESVSKLWNLKNEVSKLHSNCTFFFEFKDEEDRKKVLELGSFNISKCLSL